MSKNNYIVGDREETRIYSATSPESAVNAFVRDKYGGCIRMSVSTLSAPGQPYETISHYTLLIEALADTDDEAVEVCPERREDVDWTSIVPLRMGRLK